MNPVRMACWSAPATGPSGITSEPRSMSCSLISRPVMTPPPVGIVTQALTATTEATTIATRARPRTRLTSIRLLMVGLRQGRTVVRGKVERGGDDAHPAPPRKGQPEAGALAEL